MIQTGLVNLEQCNDVFLTHVLGLPTVMQPVVCIIIEISTEVTGAVAAPAKKRKKAMYSTLAPNHPSTPIAIETSDGFSATDTILVKDLGQYLRQFSGESKFLSYLLQKAFCCCAERQCIFSAGFTQPLSPLALSVTIIALLSLYMKI